MEGFYVRNSSAGSSFLFLPKVLAGSCYLVFGWNFSSRKNLHPSFRIFLYFVKTMEWYYDCLLITSIGVVDIERRGIFDNSSKRIEYESIDGVSYVIKGFLPTLLNYGDIVVDKMGSDIQINLQDAANPRKVEKIIMKHQEECMEKKSYVDHEALKGLLADMITTHVKKHGYKTARKD